MKNTNTFVLVGAWRGNGDKSGGIISYLQQEDLTLKRVFEGFGEISVGRIVVDRTGSRIYCVNETKGGLGTQRFSGEVYAFSIDRETGELKKINAQQSIGVFPNSIAMHPSQKYLIVSNYGSEDTVVYSERDEKGVWQLKRRCEEGNVAVLPIGEDGAVLPVCELVVHDDPPSRHYPRTQSSPKPHSVDFSPDGNLVVVTDRGCDLVVVYRFDVMTGKLTRCFSEKIPDGLGPRNSVFHPSLPYFFVACELYPYVLSFSYDAGTGTVRKTCMARAVKSLREEQDLMKNFMRMAHPADIHVHPAGNKLTVSVRGYNQISMFDIQSDTGMLTLAQEIPSGGRCPRSCMWNKDGTALYVGNQESGEISVFNYSIRDGAYQLVQSIQEERTPVCIAIC